MLSTHRARVGAVRFHVLVLADTITQVMAQRDAARSSIARYRCQIGG
jgi:hypothetical protein